MTPHDLSQLDRLGAADCSCEQAAAFFNRDVDTLRAAVRRQFGANLSEFLAEKRARGEAALLLKAHDLAKAGNVVMLKLALKSRLGWVERDATFGQVATVPEPAPRQSIIIGDKEIIF